MWNKSKKIVSLVAAATFLSAAFAMTACDKGNFKGSTLKDGPALTDKVASNGGFAVEKGEYVYFINGVENYTAENKFGEVTKGALMRIKKSDLSDWDNGGYKKVETVVPMLFVSQNFDSGIFIYDDCVYYATPTTDKNLQGEVENSWIDFKCSKLNGETPKGHLFRISNNAANYRFVQVDGVVYCLYEDTDDAGNKMLKSYNVKTGKTTLLVKGAKSSFYFDKTNVENPNVYYTMSVQENIDSDYASTPSYDQVYCVNAATVIESVNADKASYTVNGKTYDFDEEFLKEKNQEAKKNKEDQPYDLKDYTTYPYVNLGKLVLDGIGLNQDVTQFNDKTGAEAKTPEGYNYTISSYENGGIYFTKAEVANVGGAVDTRLYYLADTASDANGWSAIAANEGASFNVVAKDTTNATASALYTFENGVHEYFYVANDALYKATQPDGNTVNTIRLATGVSGDLWTIRGDYLYYYASGVNGYNLSMINCTGTTEDYNNLRVTEEFEPVTIAYVDWNSSWYKPEFVGDMLLYCNAQSFGSQSKNYIYAAKLGKPAQLKEINEKYEDVNKYINDFSEDSALQSLLRYYFRTGETSAYEAVKDLYNETQQKELDTFVEEIKNGTYLLENDFIKHIGVMKDTDAEDIQTAWENSLLSEKAEEEEESLPTWAIVLIVVGSVLVAAGAGVAVFFVIKKSKADKAAQEEASAIVNAHKKQIDTTDDKTIDVYADEAPAVEAAEEAPAEEVVEEAPVEEAVEETVEETAEETTEAPVEE